MKVVTAVKELVFRGPKVDQHTHDTHSEMLGMALIHTKVTFGPLSTSWLRKHARALEHSCCVPAGGRAGRAHLACMSAELKLLIWLKICNISWLYVPTRPENQPVSAMLHKATILS